MKKYIYKIKSGLMILMSVILTASCTDGNDWDVDDSHDRLFSIISSSISVSPGLKDAEMKWVKTPGTEYYIIELSKDSLYDDVAMGELAGVVLGEDKSIVASPYKITNLEKDTKYFVRIKAMSSLKAESYWSYPENKTFKTKTEQIMNAVSDMDKTANSVNLSWKAGEKVTKIELVKDDNIIQEIILTQNEISSGKITLTGLEAGTTYLANLYNEDDKRGYALFTTFPETPAADVIILLEKDDVIDQSYLNDLATTYPGKSITLALAAEAIYTVTEKLIIPDNMSINFFGMPGAQKTVLNLNVVDYAGNHDFITFQNLDLDCLGKGYMMNQSDAANVKRIEFDDCIVQNIKSSFFRMQNDSIIKVVESLVLNNCIFKSIGSGYYFVHIDAGSGKGVLKNLTITNSTFDRVCASGKGLIYSKSTDMESIIISHSTLYKVVGGTNYFIDFNSNKNGATNFSITNTILGMTGDANAKGIRAKNLPSLDNVYATKDWIQTSDKVEFSVYNGAAADLFVDPANEDFRYKDGSFNSNIGDPRWKE